MDPKANPRIIDCGPERAAPAVQKKPLAKKPRTEVVVQMGPFIDGNVSTPDTFENLSGPKELLIKPDTGEIAPFDPAKPVPENVIRKYITVQAQDNDVPNDLPKSGNGDYILRETPGVVGLDSDPENNVITRVEYVRESYGTSTITKEEANPQPQQECPPCDCEKPPAEEPVCEKPPAEEPVCDKPEDEEPVCEKPVDEEPVCEKPVDEEPVCEKPTECTESLDANNDLAKTKQDTPVTIDVLKNDSGCEPLCITSAHADNGLVEIVDGRIVYTPNAGFHGNDVINYSISDHGCLTDDANVFVTVDKTEIPTEPVVEAPPCEIPAIEVCADPEPEPVVPAEECETVAQTECEPEKGNESVSEVLCCEEADKGANTETTAHNSIDSDKAFDFDSIKENLFEKTEHLLDEIFSRSSTVTEKADSSHSAWSEALDSTWGKAGAVAACEDVAVVA